MVRRANPDDFLPRFNAMRGLLGEASDKDEIERETGRLPRPLPVLPGLVQSQQRGLATTKRTSPRTSPHGFCVPYLTVTAKPFASGTVGSGIALPGKGLWQSAFKCWIST